MTLQEQLRHSENPLQAQEGLSLWLASIRCLARELPHGSYHARLIPDSFEISSDHRDGKAGSSSESTATLVDSDRVVPLSSPLVHSLTADPSGDYPWDLVAPEQTGYTDDAPDVRSNVYNLGVLGFMLFSGVRPYGERSGDALLEAAAREPLPELQVEGLEAEGTAHLNRVIAKATAKIPAARHQSIDALAADVALVNVLRGATGKPGTGPLVGRSSAAARLEETVERARGGAFGSLLLLGEPGMGKTFLWQSTAARRTRSGEFWFYDKSSQIGAVPYGAVGRLSDALLEHLDGALPAGEGSPSLSAIADAEGVDPGALAILSRISTHARASDTDRDGSGLREELTSGRASIPAELARVLSVLASKTRAAIVVIDDLQWLDEQSLVVFHELLRLRPVDLTLIFIGRPEARARLPEEFSVPTLDLPGLSESESRALFDSALSSLIEPGKAPSADRMPADVRGMARGNPLIIMNMARSVAREGSFHSRAGRDASFGPAEDATLEALALSRLNQVSGSTLELLKVLAVLLPPVSVELLSRVPLAICRNPSERAPAIAEARDALLVHLEASEGRLQFAHDTVEAAVLRRALVDRRAVGSAVEALLEKADDGDDRAVFALARLLVPAGTEGREGVDVRSLVGADRERAVLSVAASRASELLSSEEALRYSEATLRRHGRLHDDSSALRLHEIAHEAAFFLDDAAAMSRHFQFIRARGDTLRVNEARKLWITRAYGHSWFLGALRIAILALAELGVEVPAEPDERQRAEVQRYLSRLGRARPAERLWSRGRATDRQTVLIIRICVRVFVSVLQVNPELVPFFIRVIISRSLAYGRTPYTGMAFLYWAMVLATQTRNGLAYYRMGRAARRYMDEGIDGLTRLTLDISTLIFTEHWGRDLHEVYRELGERHFEALRLGNLEWAGHAGHLYCVGAMFTGRPLPALLDEMEEYHARIQRLGLSRTVRALAKYQQTVEALLGRTANPLELTGSYGHERSELELYRAEGDVLAIVGSYALRGWLATYADRPDRALSDYRQVGQHLHLATSLPDVPVIFFLWGLAAWREGALSEGRRALRALRRWARQMPANQRHRYLVLLAERARHYGRRGQAARLYRRAVAAATERGYIHEAALASERLGDLLDAEERRTAQADAAFQQAFALYTRWGAVPAAHRMRTRLGWEETPAAVQPVLAERQFVKRVFGAHSADGTVRIALDELMRLAAADEGFARIDLGDTAWFYRQLRGEKSDGTVDRVEASALPARVVEWFDRRGEEPEHVQAPQGSYALICSVTHDSGVEISVVLTSKAGRDAFSSAVAARVQSALTVAVAPLGLQRLAESSREQSADLTATRRVLTSTQRNVQALFAALEDGLMLVDHQGSVLVYNSAAEEYVRGSDRGETASGENGHEEAGDARKVDPELWESMRRHVCREANAPRREVEVRWRDRVLLLAIGGGEEACAIAVRDVTELRDREEQVRRQRQQLILADRMSSLGMLASTVAHEVGNPNHILQLNVQALFMVLDRIQNDQATELLEHIMDGTQRIEAVVQQIKEYGKSGRSEEWDWLSVKAVCDSAVSFSRILVVKYTDAFEYECDIDTPLLFAARGLLEQAIVNLLKNACEALPERSSRVRLQTGYDEETQTVSISVCDQGTGIDPELTERLGTAFASGRNGEGGTGLGLSIVQTILDKHGGRLSFSSNEEFATVARMELPITPPGGTQPD